MIVARAAMAASQTKSRWMGRFFLATGQVAIRVDGISRAWHRVPSAIKLRANLLYGTETGPANTPVAAVSVSQPGEAGCTDSC